MRGKQPRARFPGSPGRFRTRSQGDLLAIKLNSPGPAHPVQERLRLNKRGFRLYKFQTMVADTEARQAQLEQMNAVARPARRIKNEPRSTRTGRFLRKTSLDDLPQLFNVLTGDMSFAGTRCENTRDDDLRGLEKLRGHLLRIVNQTQTLNPTTEATGARA